ncbi:MAG: hypothetical protein M1616_01125 [Candidatus Thermoplasmatota archaeon]|jgi:hypothetical protein|nr:hypothetical protein [Candidatus Thermoplasmatota archaeon]
MYRPKRKLILLVATVFVLLSVALFVGSAIQIQGSVSTKTATISPSSSIEITRGAGSGYFMEYSITATPSNHDLRVYAISPSGSITHEKYFNNTDSGTSVFVSGSSGTWTLVVSNTGNSNVTVNSSFGAINQYFIYLTVLGFVLIISGVALFFVYVYSKARQKKREKFRDFSE